MFIQASNYNSLSLISIILVAATYQLHVPFIYIDQSKNILITYCNLPELQSLDAFNEKIQIVCKFWLHHFGHK